MNIATSEQDGIKQARRDAVICDRATRQFGWMVSPVLGHVPLGLAMGHLTRVNPSLSVAPPITIDRRRGFLLATQDGAREAGIDWTKLDEPNSCAYSWGREMNRCSLDLYKDNQDLYTTPDSNFWKTAYLRYVLGTPMFEVVWMKAGDYVYPALVYAVNSMRELSVSVKKVVLVELPYVFELATRKGGLQSKGFGIQPVMDRSRVMDILIKPQDETIGAY